MCGICGYNWGSKGLVQKMARTLKHRGPDQSGIYTDKAISLGSTRLSIQDLSDKGRMPMADQEGSHIIVYNGEVYNFRQIREDLERKGHDFRSEGDTEVILEAYKEWGPSCLGRFNGMFAFAIWDMKKKELFLARDRLGIKPLYYYWKGGKFVFASEIKAILDDEEIGKDIDLKALNMYMAYKHIPGRRTILKDIYKLEPGHYLLLKGKQLSTRQYWDIPFKESRMDEPTAIANIDDLLNDSVERRLIADVPVGIFLSGGLDSSLITALVSKRQEGVKTFSINFKGREDNEGGFAKTVAEKFATDHHELWVGPEDVQRLLPDIAYHLDEPMNDLASIPSYLIAKFAKPKITVALTGAGGDELFVGYRQAMLNHYARYLGRAARLIPFPSATFSRSSKAISSLKLTNGIHRAASWTMIFPDLERARLFTPLVKRGNDVRNMPIIDQLRPAMRGLSPLNQNLYFESKTWLPEILLMEADKMSMMASLESRVPFLDHRLVEFMGSVPTRLKLRGFQTKRLLKKAAQSYLPKEIIHRKKQGFAIPILDWLRKDMSSYCDEILADREVLRYLDRKYVVNLFDRYKKGAEDAGFQMANLIMFSLWHKRFMQN